MIKIALRVYDTLEITVGARSLATVELIEVSHREAMSLRAL
jgi:hypothetical protein